MGDEMKHVMLANKQRLVSQFENLFACFDKDQTGCVSRSEFAEHVNDPDVADFFAILEIEVSDAIRLFDLLDTTGDEEIEIEEFVMGCLKLKGPARSYDIVDLRAESHAMARQVGAIMKCVSCMPETLVNMRDELHH